VTEEVTDEDDDSSWISALPIKAATKLEQALTKKVNDRSASLHETEQLQEVKLRIKELKK